MPNPLQIDGVVTNPLDGTIRLEAALSIRQGADGQDGFSPTITVKESTDSSYILTITNKDGSFDTPNLLAGSELGILSTKVDKILSVYPDMNPYLLNMEERREVSLYVDNNGEPEKMSLRHVALTREVDEKIKLKLQTTEGLPEKWEVGDYVFKSRLSVGS